MDNIAIVLSILSSFIILMSWILLPFYVYWKILDIKGLSKSKIAAAFFYSFLTSIPLTGIHLIYSDLSLFLTSTAILILIFIFVFFADKNKTLLKISGTIISVGISVGIETIVSMIVATISYIVILITEIVYCLQTDTEFVPVKWLSATVIRSTVLKDVKGIEIISGIVSSMLNIVVFSLLAFSVSQLFKKKRLKKGLLIWQNKETVWAGILFSIVIIVNRGWDNSFIYFIMAIAGVFGMYYWWRGQTTTLYLQRIKERDYQRYIKEHEESIRQIKELSESNQLLAKTVHRDNKLIPAMFDAVSSFLDTSDLPDKNAQGMILLRDLEAMARERKDLITAIQREHKSLPTTGIDRIDNIIRYMLSKATFNNIDFDFVLTGNIKNMTDGFVSTPQISTQQLETLLADLIENAIIATSSESYRRIQVTMCKIDNCFEITVLDSGIPFDPETLSDLGVTKTTTHAGTSGSGIGYLTIFEILREIKASLILTEYVPAPYDFLKAITVRLDGKSTYAIHSYRATTIRKHAKRDDIQIFDR